MLPTKAATENLNKTLYVLPKIVSFTKQCGKNVAQPDMPCALNAGDPRSHKHTHTTHTHTHTEYVTFIAFP